MSPATELPNIGAALTTILQRVPREQQPLLIASAERLAAERYRGWARQVSQPDRRAALLACADREEEIAHRVEALHPAAAATQQKILADNPDLIAVNETLFAPYSLTDQFTLQAQGERLGAATWRAFARHASAAETREIYLGCALLEEESAAVLEAICADEGVTP